MVAGVAEVRGRESGAVAGGRRRAELDSAAFGEIHDLVRTSNWTSGGQLVALNVCSAVRRASRGGVAGDAWVRWMIGRGVGLVIWWGCF